MICDFPKNSYIPDGKNSKMSQIINKWVFDRQTPDGNEGVWDQNTLPRMCMLH